MFDALHRANTAFHFAGHVAPPESHAMKTLAFPATVHVTGGNTPARRISFALSQANNPFPHVNTLNPGKRFINR